MGTSELEATEDTKVNDQSSIEGTVDSETESAKDAVDKVN
jgi:hypothetical protein